MGYGEVPSVVGVDVTRKGSSGSSLLTILLGGCFDRVFWVRVRAAGSAQLSEYYAATFYAPREEGARE